MPLSYSWLFSCLSSMTYFHLNLFSLGYPVTCSSFLRYFCLFFHLFPEFKQLSFHFWFLSISDFRFELVSQWFVSSKVFLFAWKINFHVFMNVYWGKFSYLRWWEFHFLTFYSSLHGLNFPCSHVWLFILLIFLTGTKFSFFFFFSFSLMIPFAFFFLIP